MLGTSKCLKLHTHTHTHTQVCSPGPVAPHSHASGPPAPLPQYDEWGSPDDSPVRDQAELRDEPKSLMGKVCLGVGVHDFTKDCGGD